MSKLDIKGWVTKWLFGRALKKGIKALVTLIISYIASAKISALLASWGIVVDVKTLETSLTGILVVLGTMLINWIKFKTGVRGL